MPYAFLPARATAVATNQRLVFFSATVANVSTVVIQFHHDKHHAAYVANTNKVGEGNTVEYKTVSKIH